MTGGESIYLDQLVQVNTLGSMAKILVQQSTEKSIFLLVGFLLLLNSNKSRIFGLAYLIQHSAGEVFKKQQELLLMVLTERLMV